MGDDLYSKLPYYEEATALGYTLHSYGSNRASAEYIKGGRLFLMVRRPYSQLHAELSFVTFSLILSSFSFDLPNKNFDTFEQKMLQMIAALDAAGIR